MSFDQSITRAEAGPLIPEDASREILQSAITESVALSQFRRVTMQRGQTRVPCLASFPVAHFRDGDTGLAQTTDMTWENRFLNAAELVAIVPIPEAVVADADYDMWGELRPRLAESIGQTVDRAVFFGTNAPAAWPTNISAAAIAAGNVLAFGTNATAAGGVAGDVSDLMSLIEADGFDTDLFVARREMKGVLRKSRDTTGQKLLDVDTSEMEGAPVVYAAPGGWPAPMATTLSARMFALEKNQFMVGVREDISWKVLDQAVIQNQAGAIQFNLAQQGMVALMVTFRCAWQVANPVTRDQAVAANRYPAALLRTA